MRPEQDVSVVLSLLASGKSLIAVHYATGMHVIQIFCIRDRIFGARIPNNETPNKTWSQEDLATLLELMRSGKRPHEIAALMPHRTRNSIIGTQHRYNLVEMIYGKRRQSSQSDVRRQNRVRMATLRRKAKEAGIAGEPAKAAPPPRPTAPPAPNHVDEIIDIPDENVPADARMKIVVFDDTGRIHANESLKSTSCRWPLGNPQSRDFGFCGRDAKPGLPYCEGHAVRAFAPPQPRRRRRPSTGPVMPQVPTFADAEKELL